MSSSDAPTATIIVHPVPFQTWQDAMRGKQGPPAIKALLDWIAVAEERRERREASSHLRHSVASVAFAADTVLSLLSVEAARKAILKESVTEETARQLLLELRTAASAVAVAPDAAPVPWALIRSLVDAVGAYEAITVGTGAYSLVGAIKGGRDRAGEARQAIRAWHRDARAAKAFSPMGPLSYASSPPAGDDRDGVDSAIRCALSMGRDAFGCAFEDVLSLDTEVRIQLAAEHAVDAAAQHARGCCPAYNQPLPARSN